MFTPSTRLSRLTSLALPFLFAVSVTAAVAAQAPAAPSLKLATDDPVVATVNGKAIHKSDVIRIKNGLGQQAAQIPLEQLYPRILNKLVDLDLIAEAARAAKIQDDPGVKDELRWQEDNVLANNYLGKFGQTAVTDADLKAAYAKMSAGQANQEEIHARHILVANEDDAKAIIDQLNKGADFAKLANEKSQDKSGDGGDLGWFTKDKMVPAFADAAFALKKGEYTKTPVKSQFGWHVILVLDRRPAKAPTFDEVKDQLRQQIENEKITAKVQELHAAAKIQEFNIDGSPMPAEKPAADAPPKP